MDKSNNDVIIRARGVRRVYHLEGETIEALRGIDLDIHRREFLSIMGPSGSGKSTLFNMIGGLDRPTDGTVLIDGEDLATLSERQLAWLRSNRIGYVFQTFNLLPTLNATENVAMPLIFCGQSPADAAQQATQMLQRVGLGHRIRHRPDQLSGGQRQRVAIARALVNQPDVILADEPTGNLDLKTGEQILSLLKDLQRQLGATVICATHDHKMLATSDRVVWIRDGRIERIAKQDEIDIEVGTVDGETVA